MKVEPLSKVIIAPIQETGKVESSYNPHTKEIPLTNRLYGPASTTGPSAQPHGSCPRPIIKTGTKTGTRAGIADTQKFYPKGLTPKDLTIDQQPP